MTFEQMIEKAAEEIMDGAWRICTSDKRANEMLIATLTAAFSAWQAEAPCTHPMACRVERRLAQLEVGTWFTRENHPENCTCWVPCETCDLGNTHGCCTCMDPCEVHPSGSCRRLTDTGYCAWCESEIALREIVTDLAQSGVEYDNPHFYYVVLQVDRDTWNKAKALLEVKP